MATSTAIASIAELAGSLLARARGPSRASGNDLANADLVARHTRPADIALAD